MNDRVTKSVAPAIAATPDDIESYLERYEAAVGVSDAVLLADYVPPPDHPSYREVVAEMIRVDLELRWSAGRPHSLGDYRERFPDVFAEPALLRAIVFEEYRLRCQHGERAAPRDYATRFSIDVSDWPTFSADADAQLGPPSSVGFDSAHVLDAVDADFPASGTVFAGFELVAELGRGAFARVYLARQTELACRFVALKVSVGANVEAQRLAQLQHTNIVPIYSVHRQGKLQAVAMPFFGATTLAGLLRTVRRHSSLPASAKELLSTLAADAASTIGGDAIGSDVANVASSAEQPPLRHTAQPLVSASITRSNTPRDVIERLSYVDAAVWIVARIAEGLAHAHARGLLHRDLKPANILLTDDGQPMILDFNLSVDMASPSQQASIGGTLPYMAPEHLTALAARGDSAPAIDARADVYSLGVILFELLTGEQPFPQRVGPIGEVALAMAADRRGALPSARKRNPSVPHGVDAIVRKALASDTQLRYASAAEFAEDLNRHLSNLPLHHAADRSPIERARKWIRRHPRLSSFSSVATLCVVLLVGIAIAWHARQQHFAAIAAVSRYDVLSAKLRSIRAPLSAMDLDAATLRQTIAEAEAVLDEYQVVDHSDWRQSEPVALLDQARRDALTQAIGETALLLGRALDRQAAINAPGRKASLARAQDFRALGDNFIAAAADASTRANDRYLAALEAARGAQYDRAAEMLTQARADGPQDVGVWFSLGNVFAAMGRHHEAEGCFTTAAALEPASPWAVFYRGATRMNLRDFGGAESDFTAALEVKPDWAVALANRGLARMSLGKTREALADLDRALDLGCSQTRLYFVRAKLRKANGDAAGAESDFKQGLALTPTDDKSWVARALARLPGDAAGALADLKHAAAIFPGNRMIQQDLAHVVGEYLHDNNAALTVMNEIVAMTPNDVDALTGRAVLLARLGRRDAALADARLAANIKSSAETSYKLGCVYALVARDANGDADAAVRYVAQAMRQDGRFVEIAKGDADLKGLRSRDDFRRLLAAGELIQQTSQARSSQK